MVLPLQVAPLYWFVCSHSKDHLINTPFILLFTGSHPTMQWASKMGSRVSLLRQWIRDWEVCFQNYELPYFMCLQCSDFLWICIRALKSHQYHCRRLRMFFWILKYWINVDRLHYQSLKDEKLMRNMAMSEKTWNFFLILMVLENNEESHEVPLKSRFYLKVLFSPLLQLISTQSHVGKIL